MEEVNSPNRDLEVLRLRETERQRDGDRKRQSDRERQTGRQRGEITETESYKEMEKKRD